MQLSSIPLEELKLRVAHCDMLDKLIKVADGDAALLYLYLLRKGNPGNGYAVDDSNAMRELRMSPDRYQRAAFTLRNLTLPAGEATAATATTAAKEYKTSPKYTPEELGQAREADSDFQVVCQTAEETLGWMLNESQLSCLFTAYDYLGLSAEAIIELLSYLKREKNRVKINDITREATLWADAGVVSAADAQRYLASKTNELPLVAALCKGLGLNPTEASPKIQNAAALLSSRGFPPAAVDLAISRCERHRENKNLAYVMGILNRWHQANAHTISEITALEPETRAQATRSSVRPPSSAAKKVPAGQDEPWEETSDFDEENAELSDEEEERLEQMWLEQSWRFMQKLKEEIPDDI